MENSVISNHAGSRSDSSKEEEGISEVSNHQGTVDQAEEFYRPTTPSHLTTER